MDWGDSSTSCFQKTLHVTSLENQTCYFFGKNQNYFCVYKVKGKLLVSANLVFRWAHVKCFLLQLYEISGIPLEDIEFAKVRPWECLNLGINAK